MAPCTQLAATPLEPRSRPGQSGFTRAGVVDAAVFVGPVALSQDQHLDLPAQTIFETRPRIFGGEQIRCRQKFVTPMNKKFNPELQRRGDVMKKRISVVLFGIVALSAMVALAGDKNPIVGGQEMYPTKDIIDNAVNSADHTTLVAAVKAAGLVDTLKGPGPFTVFAPTNEAFAKLPAGTVDNLLKPENKDTLTKILTYHVVAGRLSAADIRKQIKAGNGQAELKTVSGGTLTATMKGKNIVLKDEKGDLATVTIPNVYQSNGVIDVIDTVLLPN
jgi:uncharacterized surface protein with fasciclin (FAS1) repeats